MLRGKSSPVLLLQATNSVTLSCADIPVCRWWRLSSRHTFNRGLESPRNRQTGMSALPIRAAFSLTDLMVMLALLSVTLAIVVTQTVSRRGKVRLQQCIANASQVNRAV